MDEQKRLMQMKISSPAQKGVLEVLLVCQQGGQARGILLAALVEV